jgi:hypothetical protein
MSSRSGPEGLGVEAPGPALSGWSIEALGEGEEQEASAMERVMEAFG